MSKRIKIEHGSVPYLGIKNFYSVSFYKLGKDPTSNNYKQFHVMDLWYNYKDDRIWYLASKTKTYGTWTQIASAGSLLAEDGQVLIGATGGQSKWANITSTGGTVTISNTANGINLEAAGGTATNTYEADDGNSVSPDGSGNINLFGGNNISTTATVANTVTFNLDDNITLTSITTTGDVTVGGTLAYYISINEQTADYTLVITDAGKEIRMNSSSNLTLTIPTNASVAFTTGTQIIVVGYGSGTVSIAGATGVTIRSASGYTDLYEQYSVALLVKQNTDEWLLSGDIR